jgi:hypothetical protein
MKKREKKVDEMKKIDEKKMRNKTTKIEGEKMDENKTKKKKQKRMNIDEKKERKRMKVLIDKKCAVDPKLLGEPIKRPNYPPKRPAFLNYRSELPNISGQGD